MRFARKFCRSVKLRWRRTIQLGSTSPTLQGRLWIEMIEDQAPLSYDIAAEIEFRVNADGTVEVKQGNGWINAADAKIQMVDELTKRDVFFSKTTLGQGNELKGAKITVSGTDANGQAFNESWISDGAAKELKLKAGEYTMVEDQAPLGYDKEIGRAHV